MLTIIVGFVQNFQSNDYLTLIYKLLRFLSNICTRKLDFNKTRNFGYELKLNYALKLDSLNIIFRKIERDKKLIEKLVSHSAVLFIDTG